MLAAATAVQARYKWNEDTILPFRSYSMRGGGVGGGGMVCSAYIINEESHGVTRRVVCLQEPRRGLCN